MKSDPLFYELFQVRPQIFFELANITPACPYRFESITVKSTEKRIDGVLEPSVSGQPIYFVEVQAKPDPQMYWRTVRETSLYFEQRPDLEDTDWYAYVIWLNKINDKGFKKTSIYDEQKVQRILSVHLIDILKKLPHHSLALNVLRPLLVDSEEEVRQNIVNWAEQIHQTPDLSPEAEQRLLMVMTQFIEEKFKTLNYEELTKMLNLTPFEQTTTFVETYQRKLQEDLQNYSMDLLIQMVEAKFKFSQKTLNRLVARLRLLTLDDLKAMFREIIVMKRLKDINAWIDERLAAQQAAESAEIPPVNER